MSELSNTSEDLGRILDVVNDIRASLPGLAKNIKNAVVLEQEQVKTGKALIAATKALNDITDKTSAAYKKAAKEANLLEEKYQTQASQLKELEKNTSNATTATNRLAAAQGSLGEKFRITSAALKQGHGILTSFNKEMGVQSLTFSNAYKSLIKYNAGMFTLSKTQRLFGAAGNDTSAAMKIFRTQTTMSTVQALEFTNSFNKMYLGVQPTTQAIAKFGAQLQQSFGPNVAQAMEASKALLAIQNKFPPLFDRITAAQEKMNSKNLKTQKEGSKEAAGNLAMMLAMGTTTEEFKTVATFQAGSSKKEIGFQATEEVAAKAAQTSEEAILGLGKTSEEVFQGMAKVLEKTYGLFESNAKGAFLMASAVTAVGVAQNIAFGSIGRLFMPNGSKGLVSKAGSKVMPKVFKGAMSGVSTNGTMRNAMGFGTGGGTVPTFRAAYRGARAAPGAIAQAGRQAGRQAWAGGGRMVGAVRANPMGTALTGAAMIKLGADIAGFANVMGQTKDDFDRNAKALADKGTFLRVVDGIFQSGKVIATALRLVGESISNIKIQKEQEKEIKKGEKRSLDLWKEKYGKERVGKIVKASGWETAENKTTGATKTQKTLGFMLGGLGGMKLMDIAMKKRGVSDKGKDNAWKEIQKEILKISKEENAERDKGIQKLEKTGLLYLSEEKTLSFQLEMQKKINSTIESRIGIAGKFFSVTKEMLQEQIDGEYKRAAKAGEYLANTKKLGIILAKNLGDDKYIRMFAKLDPKDLRKTLSSVQQEVDATLEGAKKKEEEILAKQNPTKEEKREARNAVEKAEKNKDEVSAVTTKVSTAELDQTQGIANAKEYEITLQDKLISQSDKLLDSVSKRISAQRQVYEEAHFGQRLSMQMMNQEIKVANERIRLAKTYAETTKNEILSKHNISEEDFQALETAITMNEITAATSNILGKQDVQGKKKVWLAEQLKLYYERQNEATSKEYQEKKKINDLTKGIREGYLHAIMAMQMNAGVFAKIIGTETKAKTQMMNQVERAEGFKALNTRTFGGTHDAKTKEELNKKMQASGRLNPYVTFGAYGGEFPRTDKQEKHGDTNDFYMPKEIKGKSLKEQEDWYFKNAQGGAHALSTQQTGVIMAGGGIPSDTSNKNIEEETERRIKKGKGIIPLAAEHENYNPDTVVNFGGNLIKSTVDNPNNASDWAKMEGETSKYWDEKQKALGLDQESIMGKDIAASDFKPSSNIIGTILVSIDKNGELKDTVIEVKSDIVNLQQAVGQV